MPATTTREFTRLLRSLPLLDPQQQAELERLQGQDVRTLSRELIQRGWLTPFQVNQLLQGKAGELVLGSYLLLERLGEGGMGQVFKARHQKMGRVVALKLIRKDRLQNPEASRRFEREIKAAAQLSHPNIVTAFDAAQVGDNHFLVMEYVEGVDLARHVKQCGPLPVEQAIAYTCQAALGLQHAHERGLVHRDIKPSNLLVSLKEGNVKILDLGLARMLEHAENDATNPLTETEAIVGTPDYEAPEQARQSRQADVRADLYSLGCTLYFLLTGQPPFPGGNTTEKLVKHQLDEPTPLSQLRPGIPSGLAAVVHKLMAKRPEDRFQTPAELVTVLEAGLKTGAWTSAQTGTIRVGRSLTTLKSSASTVFSLVNEESRARRYALEGWSRGKQFVRYLAAGEWRGRKGIAVGAASLLLLFLLTLWFKPFGLWSTGLDRLRARDITAADRSVTGALEGLVGVLGDQRLRQWGRLRVLAVSGDGKFLASGGDDGFMRIWDAATGQQARAIPYPHPFYWLGFFDGSRWLGTTDVYGNMKFWEVATGQESPAPPGRRVGHTSQRIAIGTTSIKIHDLPSGQERITLQGITKSLAMAAFSGNGQVMAGCDDLNVLIWDLSSSTPRQTLKGHAAQVQHASLSWDGRVLASVDNNNIVKVWDVGNGRELLSLTVRWAWGLSGDGSTLVLCGADGETRLYDTASGRSRASLRHENGPITSLAFSPDGKVVASGTSNPGDSLRIWDLASGNQRAALVNNQAGAIQALVFLPDSTGLVSASGEGRIKIWDLDGQERLPGDGRADWYTAAAFSPDGKTLALTVNGSSTVLWDVPSTHERSRLPGLPRGVSFTAFSPDSQMLAVAGQDGIVKLWDLTTGQLHSTLNHGRYGITSMHFSASSKVLGTSEWYSFKVWDVATGQARVSLDASKSGIATGALSPDGGTAAIVGNDNVIQLWDVANKKLVNSIPGQRNPQVAFAPDGRTLLIRQGEGAIRLWDLSNQRERAALPACAGWVLSPRGETITLVLPDGRLQVWDMARAQMLTPLEGHTKPVKAAAYSFDGQRVASVGEDGKVILWDPASRRRKAAEWQLAGPVNGVAFAADNRHLATVNGNGSVYFFRLPD